jgi:hypothetical protein
MTLKWIKDWVEDLVKGRPEREQQQQQRQGGAGWVSGRAKRRELSHQ